MWARACCTIRGLVAIGERQGRAVILTALGLEYDTVRAWLTDLQLQVHRSGTRYERGRLTDADAPWEVVLAEIGAGNQTAATLTGQAIDTFDPDLVLFVGVAGSLVDSVWLGDQVLRSSVIGRTGRPRPRLYEHDWKASIPN
jgi:nucleoside phosphorylase